MQMERIPVKCRTDANYYAANADITIVRQHGSAS